MVKILLMGNPNVGKSAIFSHLTGVNVTISNYPGTTVQYAKGYLTYNGQAYEVIDVPGTYQLDPEAESEKVAADMVEAGDVLVNVVDSTNLERNLNLTLQLMDYGKPMVMVLNMWDDAKHKGIEINIDKLQKLLKVPVIATNGLTGEGLNILPEKCVSAERTQGFKLSATKRWEAIGNIVTEVQNLSHRHHTFIEKLQELSIHPLFGLPISLVLLYIAFKMIITAGEILTEYTTRIFDIAYTPFILWMSRLLGGQGLIHSLLLGEISGSQIDYEGAMGVLTTGVFVAIGIVLPYIVLFYLVFGFLEDLGYLPRVAIILDRLLHKIGLHGYSVIPMLLACGCNVPGVLAIRNLETRRERFITAVITCTTIPCMAQTALIVKVVGERGGIYIALTFATLFSVWAIMGMVLKKTVKGNTPTLLMEVPPYRIPNIRLQIKKLWMRIKCFLKEAIPYVLGGILLINFLHVFGVIAWIGKLFSPLVKGVFGLPEDTVAALIIGIVRKDAAIALLEPIGLNSMQMVTAAVVLTLYFPCVATFTVLFKELGMKDTARAVVIMLIATLAAGGGLNLLGYIYSPGFVIAIELVIVVLMSIFIPLVFKSEQME
ncbi:MAG: ferrous iron transporter B [Clostridiaceae bacterium]|nr:ferrous iron transporter B [Clostridiaceae bacterium]